MKHRAVLGGLIWVVTISIIGSLLSTAELDSRWGRLWRFMTKTPQTLQVKVPKDDSVVAGERVMGIKDGRLCLLGRVIEVSKIDQTHNIAVVAMDPETAPVTANARFQIINNRGNMSWAIDTILPEHKREKIKDELISFKNQHRREIMDIGQIVAKNLVSEAIEVLNANLSDSVRKHDKEWRAVIKKHRGSLKKELIPTLKKEMGPTINKKVNPILEVIGREIWNEVSVWDVGWGAFKDKIPGGNRKNVEEWWAKFLEEKLMPILQEHEGDFVELAEDLAVKAAENEAIQEKMTIIARRLIDDPEFRNLVNIVLNEALVQPFETDRFLKKMMANKELQNKFNTLNVDFGPVLHRITWLIVQDEEKGEGVNPDLVQVLRRVFFERQDRALMVNLDTVGGSAVASKEQVFPAEAFAAPAEAMLSKKNGTGGSH